MKKEKMTKRLPEIVIRLVVVARVLSRIFTGKE